MPARAETVEGNPFGFKSIEGCKLTRPALRISQHDRVMILAPHPDDETLGAGGLIQRVMSAGAKLRVLFVTDGDNNPWPQRVAERRIVVSSRHRARWGIRRRREAQRAVELLTNGCCDPEFLSLPDQGMTRILMEGPDALMGILSGSIGEYHPTVIVSPSLYDAHSDHNSLAVILQFVLRQSAAAPPRRVLSYQVHPARQTPPIQPAIDLRLSPEERERKLDAILVHGSQMILSKRRFTALARADERFYLPLANVEKLPGHSIPEAVVENGILRLEVDFGGAPRLPGRVLVAMQSQAEGSLRWALPLVARSACAYIRDTATGATLRRATIRVHGFRATVRIPLTNVIAPDALFVKHEQPRLFYDRSGWRAVPLPSRPWLEDPSFAENQCTSSAPVGAPR